MTKSKTYLFALTTLCLLSAGWTKSGCRYIGDETYMVRPDPLAADGQQALTLETAVPSGTVEGGHPGIVFIHGGGWKSGSLGSSNLLNIIEQAADRGYVAATINYSLTKLKNPDGSARFSWPSQIGDAKCAVRWMRANADRLGLNRDKIGVVGISAGGHLALMLGETSDEPGLFESPLCDNTERSDVQVVVNFYGPADLNVLYPLTKPSLGGRDVVSALLDLDPDVYPASDVVLPEDVATLADASPSAYVSDNGVPVLTMQGLADELVVPEVAKAYHAILDAETGRENLLIEFTGQAHGFTGGALTFARGKMWDFLNRHLNGKPVVVECEGGYPACKPD